MELGSSLVLGSIGYLINGPWTAALGAVLGFLIMFVAYKYRPEVGEPLSEVLRAIPPASMDAWEGTREPVELPISDPHLAMLRERQRLEAELQPLVEIQEGGVRVTPALRLLPDDISRRGQKIVQLRRDIAVIDARLGQSSPMDTQGPEIMVSLSADFQFVIHNIRGGTAEKVDVELWHGNREWLFEGPPIPYIEEGKKQEVPTRLLVIQTKTTRSVSDSTVFPRNMKEFCRVIATEADQEEFSLNQNFALFYFNNRGAHFTRDFVLRYFFFTEDMSVFSLGPAKVITRREIRRLSP